MKYFILIVCGVSSQVLLSADLSLTSVVDDVANHLNSLGYCKLKSMELSASDPKGGYIPQLIAWAVSEDASRSAAAHELLASVKPFPLKELFEYVKIQTDSRNLTEALWLLNHHATNQADKEMVILIARRMLADERPGFRTFGDAKAYAKDGIRLADVAHNVLVEGLFGGEKWPLITSGLTTYPERSQLIDKMKLKLGIPVVSRPPARLQQNGASVLPRIPNSDEASTKQSNHAPLPAASLDSLVRISIFLAIPIAAIGLLWLLLKRRAKE